MSAAEIDMRPNNVSRTILVHDHVDHDVIASSIRTLVDIDLLAIRRRPRQALRALALIVFL